MGYKVKEVIETDREGNKKRNERNFKTYGDAVRYIKQRMKEIIKQDNLKFFRETNQKITTKKLDRICGNELEFWLGESDNGQFPYVANYLEWSCFWSIKEITQ